MSELKCPFCGEKLNQTYSFNPTQFWCSNYYDPKHPIHLQGTKELWQELIRTRKALEIALDAINRLENQNYKNCAWHLRLAIAKIKAIGIANNAIDKITALEQNEHFADASKTIEQKD